MQLSNNTACGTINVCDVNKNNSYINEEFYYYIALNKDTHLQK